MGITAKDHVSMWRTVARQLKAGSQLTPALRCAIDESESEELKAAVNGVLSAAESGKTFDEALDEHADVFPRTTLMMVKAGAAGGVLDVIAERTAAGIEKGAFPLPGEACVPDDAPARAWRALAILLSSGVPILKALDLICEEVVSGKLRLAFRRMHQNVLGGGLLSDAVREMGDVFDGRVADALAVGEHAGTVDERMAEIADALERGDLSTLPRLHAPAPIKKMSTPDVAPVVKLVNTMLLEAIREGATDIHIDHTTEESFVRYRISGALHRKMEIPRNQWRAVLNRLKIMAMLDVMECRRPQDGKIWLNVKGEGYDVRISSLPGVNGESIVMRIIPQSNMIRSLDQLGLSDEKLAALKDLAHRPYGLVLVSGPAGSGKSTLMFSLLSEIDRDRCCVVSIEDPVAVQIPGVRQVQINRKGGLTPATALRSVMRQDPDVIFVGDIYEADVAQLAINAAITGHLVFALLHAPTSTAAMQLMLDLGVEPHRLNGSLIASVSQRLVRKLCVECRREVRVDESTVPASVAANLRGRTSTIYAPGSCDVCTYGYRGRAPIHEIMKPTAESRRALTGGATEEELREVLKAGGMKTLLGDGLDLVAAGVTSLDEVWRMVADAR